MYLRFAVAVAILAAVLYAYSAIASAPTATPVIVNNNASLPANASVALANQQLFFAANFSSENASQEVNSTFKWYKRTLYQPQNRLTSEAEL